MIRSAHRTFAATPKHLGLWPRRKELLRISGDAPIRAGQAGCVFWSACGRFASQGCRGIPVVTWFANCKIQDIMSNSFSKKDQTGSLRSVLEEERFKLVSGRSNTIEELVLPRDVAVEDHGPLVHDQFIALRHIEWIATS
jgi:hypothetical protein